SVRNHKSVEQKHPREPLCDEVVGTLIVYATENRFGLPSVRKALNLPTILKQRKPTELASTFAEHSYPAFDRFTVELKWRQVAPHEDAGRVSVPLALLRWSDFLAIVRQLHADLPFVVRAKVEHIHGAEVSLN